MAGICKEYLLVCEHVNYHEEKYKKCRGHERYCQEKRERLEKIEPETYNKLQKIVNEQGEKILAMSQDELVDFIWNRLGGDEI
jgi:hypothetical protein